MDKTTQSLLDALASLMSSGKPESPAPDLPSLIYSMARIKSAMSITLFIQQMKTGLINEGIESVNLTCSEEYNDNGGTSKYFSFSDCSLNDEKIKQLKIEYPDDFEDIDFGEDICDSLSGYVSFALVEDVNLEYFLESNSAMTLKSLDKLEKSLLGPTEKKIIEYLNIKTEQEALNASTPTSNAHKGKKSSVKV